MASTRIRIFQMSRLVSERLKSAAAATTTSLRSSEFLFRNRYYRRPPLESLSQAKIEIHDVSHKNIAN